MPPFLTTENNSGFTIFSGRRIRALEFALTRKSWKSDEHYFLFEFLF